MQRIFNLEHPNTYEVIPYLCKDGEKHPFAVICPGGGYETVASSSEGAPYAKELNQRGYHAFVVFYRVKDTEQVLYPVPQDDLAQAIQEILSRSEEYHLATDGWSLWGSSAGAHLAASYCADPKGSPLPAALILAYPVITMGEYAPLRSKINLLGELPDPELVEKLSVEKNVTSSFPPTYLWNGTADTMVNPIHSRMMESALHAAGVPCKAEIFEGVRHAVGLGKKTNAKDWFDHAIDFWEER